MAEKTKPTAQRAVVIPFPRFRQPPHRRALAAPGFTSPDFDAGFECAMAMLKSLKARGLPVHI